MPHRAVRGALSETARQLRHPASVLSLIGIGVVLAIAAPFGTNRLMGLGARLVYWPLIAFSTYGLGVFVDAMLSPRLGKRLPHGTCLSIIALTTGATVALFVTTVNDALFEVWTGPGGRAAMVFGIFSIGVVVTVLHDALERQFQTPAQVAAASATSEAESGASDTVPPLFDRLPRDIHAPLVAISVQDHYVRVRTTKGEEHLLMRLSDAIREVGATRGAQVHRSHWAAFDQVTQAARAGDRALLTMSDGSKVPVSRARVALVKDAGLLH